MQRAMSEARRVLAPSGIGVVVFAHKSTGGWEALLQAIVAGGLTITGSWPIDTEMGSRLRARDWPLWPPRFTWSVDHGAGLNLVPREVTWETGEGVLGELPRRIHEWMPRWREESGWERMRSLRAWVPLWNSSRATPRGEGLGRAGRPERIPRTGVGCCAREALSLIFEGADATGLEEDATTDCNVALDASSTGGNGTGNSPGCADGEEDEGEEDGGHEQGESAGLSLLSSMRRERLLRALGRTLRLEARRGNQGRRGPTSFCGGTNSVPLRKGWGAAECPRGHERRSPSNSACLRNSAAVEKEAGWGDVGLPPVGETTLNRVHQAMILFAAGGVRP